MKKILLYCIISILALFIIFSSVLILIAVLRQDEVYDNLDSVSEVVDNLQPRVIEIDNVTVKAQPDGFTCGITTVAIMSNFFNSTNNEANDLIDRHNITSGGATNDEMVAWLQGELPGRTIAFRSNVTNEVMLSDIHASLYSGNPVMIAFAAPNSFNEPYYDSHASVVYGINLDSETIMIANAYGFNEEISLLEFINRMSYTEISKFPFLTRVVWVFLDMGVNSYILVE